MKFQKDHWISRAILYVSLVFSTLAAGCTQGAPQPAGEQGLPATHTSTGQPAIRATAPMKTTSPSDEPIKADVLTVKASGSPGAYRFAVEVRSPDLGCQQYADWWEVISEDGDLLYRRILAHSHVDEQPFVRSGGPLPIEADTVVWVRAHMNTSGYGGTALKGSVNSGFQEADLDPDFAPELANTPPLPEGCAF